MVAKTKAFGPDPRRSYTYRELPIGSTSIGLCEDLLKTGTWRTAIRPVLRTKTAPCMEGCPAGVNIRGFISLIKQGLFREAYNLYVDENPFPAICGRVCYHPCEGVCNRKDFDQAVGINALERLLADFDGPVETVGPSRGKRVSVIGSGPAGMACSYYLARLGYDVTVFESLEVIGGLLRTGIPDYRLPVEVVEREVEKLKRLGIKFMTKQHIDGKKWHDLESFDAVVIAHGASVQIPAPFVSGRGLDRRVISGLDFLKEVKMGEDVALGRKVVVIGGGNTAIDAARVAVRLGASPTVLYRRSRAEMPAFEEEVEDALEEGIQIQFLTSPVGIEQGEPGLTIKCVRNRLTEIDESRRPRPIPVEGSEFLIESDNIISAIGETSDLSFLPKEVQVSGQSIEVNELGLTTMSGVFACGDVTGRERTVVHAIGMAKKAAVAIDCHLRQRPYEDIGEQFRLGEKGNISFRHYLAGTLPLESQKVVYSGDLNFEYFCYEERHEKPKIPKEYRTLKKEVYGCLSMEQAREEAGRCFGCGMCSQCDNCYIFCPDSSVIKQEDGEMHVIDYEYCKGCGICAHECPTGAIEMEKEE
jgi:2-oxoacid:acceptor oxidoreductase delta subunit (pyruvate/2-ketoisovalerate family)